MASGGTGTSEVKETTNAQSRLLLLVLTAAILAATSWLSSKGTDHEMSVKEAVSVGIREAVKEVMAGQQKEAEKTVQAVKETKPPAAPPIVVVPTAAPAQTNPLLALPPEVAAKYLAEYLKTQQDKKQP